MRSFFVRGLLVSLIVSLIALPSWAQFEMILTSDSLIAAPGDTVTYEVTLQNFSTTDTYFINDFFGSSSDPNITVDSASALLYLPTSVAPGASWVGSLVDVNVDGLTPDGTLGTGIFTLLGGTSSTQSLTLDSDTYELLVLLAAPVPEPSTIVLSMAGLAALGLSLRRRLPVKG